MARAYECEVCGRQYNRTYAGKRCTYCHGVLNIIRSDRGYGSEKKQSVALLLAILFGCVGFTESQAEYGAKAVGY